MITTLIPIEISKNLIRDNYLKYNNNNNNWKCIDEDTNHIKIDSISFNVHSNELAHNIDWKTIDNKHHHEQPAPDWLLIKLKEFTDILINDILIYGGMSIPFCNWILNDTDKKDIIIIQLDDIRSGIDYIIFNVKIITLECLSSSYPDHVYEIKIPI